MTSEAFAPAKINLALHVTGQRADGYHLLDSLVVFADVGDRMTLTPGEMQITVSGPFAEGVPTDDRNLVWRAAVRAGWRGHVHIEKTLPHGAGLGGGSADAAALLRALFGDRVSDGIGLGGALALGADVPVCLHAGPQRMRGIGEVLTRVWPVPSYGIVLINPRVPVPTGPVFKGLPRKDNPPMGDIPCSADPAAFATWLTAQRNDLEGPARAQVPVIGDVLATLRGALLARMSGSGATCFGLYADIAAAQAAAQQIAAAHPHWWVRAGTTAGAVN